MGLGEDLEDVDEGHGVPSYGAVPDFETVSGKRDGPDGFEASVVAVVEKTLGIAVREGGVVYPEVLLDQRILVQDVVPGSSVLRSELVGIHGIVRIGHVNPVQPLLVRILPNQSVRSHMHGLIHSQCYDARMHPPAYAAATPAVHGTYPTQPCTWSASSAHSYYHKLNQSEPGVSHQKQDVETYAYRIASPVRSGSFTRNQDDFIRTFCLAELTKL